MSVELEWSQVDGDHGLRLTGWSPGAQQLLSGLDERGIAERIVVLPAGLAGADGDDLDAPVASSRLGGSPGRFMRDAGGVTFVPRFPFLGDRAYTVLVHPALCGASTPGVVDVSEYQRITIAARRAPRPSTTTVQAIHPATPVVPRNLLRCYVEFSAPMSEGDAPECVHLVDAGTGDAVPGAFLDMDPELWDPARTRLTVFLDPARIKRGLAPHREAGYALVEGGSVAIVVDAAFRDADGRPLVEQAVRRYDVGPDVRGRIDPAAWAVASPRAGSRDPLVVTFDRPLDHALLAHCLRIDVDGTAVVGDIEVSDGDTAWSCTPAEPWRPVRHRLVVDAMLEDVAGNSAIRVFDRDLADATHEPMSVRHVTREFEPA